MPADRPKFTKSSVLSFISVYPICMKKIKYLIFDFDGTLGNRRAYEEIAAREIVSKMPISDPWEIESAVHDLILHNCAGTAGYPNTFRWMKEHYPVGDMNTESYGILMRHGQADHVCLYPDTMNTLLQLKERGYVLGIISDGESQTQHQKVDQSGVAKLMSAVIVSDDIGFKKPDFRIFRACLDQLHAEAEECAYVGDIYSKDVLGAVKAGMMPVWMNTYGNTSSRMNVTVIHHLSELLDLFH